MSPTDPDLPWFFLLCTLTGFACGYCAGLLKHRRRRPSNHRKRP